MVKFWQSSESKSRSKSSSESVGVEQGGSPSPSPVPWRNSAEYDMAEFFSPKGKRVGVESDKDKFSISLAILGRRISAEVISPSCSRRGVSVLAGSIR